MWHAIKLRRDEVAPGETASASGWYELLNVFGTPTGERMFIKDGHPSPKAPLGHTWQLEFLPRSGTAMAANQSETTPLATARRHVREAEVRLAQQEAKVAQLESKNQPAAAALANSVLETMRKSLDLMKHHLRHLEETFP
jgi:hypothetical protein